MRCPKCGYVSFDTQTNCGKCGENLLAVAAVLAGTAVKVESSFFLAPVVALANREGEGELAEALASLPLAEEEGGEEEEGIAMPESLAFAEEVPTVDLSRFAPSPEEEQISSEGLTLEELAGEAETVGEGLGLALEVEPLPVEPPPPLVEEEPALDLALEVETLPVEPPPLLPEEEPALDLALEAEPSALTMAEEEAPRESLLVGEEAEFTLELDDSAAEELGEEGEELAPLAGGVDLEEIDLSDLVDEESAPSAKANDAGEEEHDLTAPDSGGGYSRLDRDSVAGGGTGDDILDLDFVLGGQPAESKGEEEELQGIDLSLGGQNDIFDLLLEMGEEPEAKAKKEEAAAPAAIADLGLTLEKDAE